MAYITTVSDQFGAIDLNTGVFTQLGNMDHLLSGLGVVSGNVYGAAEGGDTLYRVNLATGFLTAVGTGSIRYYDFGSTTSGMYAVDSNLDLYSINPSNGAATLIGPTGLRPDFTKGLSTGSGTLYFTNSTDLYWLNTTTGKAMLIGNTGLQIGALVFENGALYAGVRGFPDQVYTLNTSTGAATLVANTSGRMGHFWGLAAEPLTATPEPSSLLLFGTALLGLAASVRRCLRS
jgi:hypothetical protein